PMPRPQLILLGCFAGSNQIPQRFVRRIRHPHRRQLSGSMIPRQLQRIATIRFHPVPALHRHQRRRNHFALRSQRRQLPVQNVARWPCFITKSQILHWPQFLHQSPNRFLAVRNLTQRPHLPFLLGYRHRYRFRMDIHPHKLYPLHRPAPFALWLCTAGLSDPQHNPRSRTRAGRSIVTTNSFVLYSYPVRPVGQPPSNTDFSLCAVPKFPNESPPSDLPPRPSRSPLLVQPVAPSTIRPALVVRGSRQLPEPKFASELLPSISNPLHPKPPVRNWFLPSNSAVTKIRRSTFRSPTPLHAMCSNGSLWTSTCTVTFRECAPSGTVSKMTILTRSPGSRPLKAS